ncbi:MAG: tRNA nucleotidyltransferase [Desulfovibrionales bacterium]
MDIYLVGGAVRDSLRNVPEGDRDYVVLNSSEEELLAVFPRAIRVGRESPVYITGNSQYTLSPAKTIVEDLKSRDLTINALARDPAGSVVGLDQSFEDLRDKVLRPVAAENFFKDPARVFRAARFAACLPDHTPAPELFEAMANVNGAGVTQLLSAERVGQEMSKALGCPDPGRFFSLLDRTGGLRPWFGELAEALEVPVGSGAGTLFDHTLSVIKELRGDRAAVWMGVCHALGCVAEDARENACAGASPEAGALRAEDMGSRLRLPKALVRAGAVAARWIRAGVHYDQLPAPDKVDLLERLWNAGLVQPFFSLVRACSGKNFHDQAQADLQRMLAVTLPAEERDLGELSGRRLRSLRSQAIASGGERE